MREYFRHTNMANNEPKPNAIFLFICYVCRFYAPDSWYRAIVDEASATRCYYIQFRMWPNKFCASSKLQMCIFRHELITSSDVIQFEFSFFLLLCFSSPRWENRIHSWCDEALEIVRWVWKKEERMVEKSGLLTEKWMWKYVSSPDGSWQRYARSPSWCRVVVLYFF